MLERVLRLSSRVFSPRNLAVALGYVGRHFIQTLYEYTHTRVHLIHTNLEEEYVLARVCTNIRNGDGKFACIQVYTDTHTHTLLTCALKIPTWTFSSQGSCGPLCVFLYVFLSFCLFSFSFEMYENADCIYVFTFMYRYIFTRLHVYGFTPLYWK